MEFWQLTTLVLAVACAVILYRVDPTSYEDLDDVSQRNIKQGELIDKFYAEIQDNKRQIKIEQDKLKGREEAMKIVWSLSSIPAEYQLLNLVNPHSEHRVQILDESTRCVQLFSIADDVWCITNSKNAIIYDRDSISEYTSGDVKLEPKATFSHLKIANTDDIIRQIASFCYVKGQIIASSSPSHQVTLHYGLSVINKEGVIIDSIAKGRFRHASSHGNKLYALTEPQAGNEQLVKIYYWNATSAKWTLDSSINAKETFTYSYELYSVFATKHAVYIQSVTEYFAYSSQNLKRAKSIPNIYHISPSNPDDIAFERMVQVDVSGSSLRVHRDWIEVAVPRHSEEGHKDKMASIVLPYSTASHRSYVCAVMDGQGVLWAVTRSKSKDSITRLIRFKP